MPDPRHFSLPFRFERVLGELRVATTEQDSSDEIADCVELIVRTRQGDRLRLIEFGRPDSLDFSINPELAAAQLQEAIDVSEPRVRSILSGDHDPSDPAILRLRVLYDLQDET